MKRSTLRLALVFGFPLFSLSSAFAQVAPQEPASFYTVAEYGVDRDPAEDLKATVERAQAEGKRILIQVGGDWCGWCKLLDGYIHDHSSISEKIEAGFLIMKVTYDSKNRNEAFLGQYPRIQGYPHLYVLEKDGTLLYSKNTVELEEGRSYNEQAILEFLDEWMAEG
ncbi:MAG: thioredoxin family protein [Gemmatimonadetes bacterium]|nr:thioredoxin family protein [Gemmatimonadota bacterium]